jgi:hypothetical protein
MEKKLSFMLVWVLAGAGLTACIASRVAKNIQATKASTEIIVTPTAQAPTPTITSTITRAPTPTQTLVPSPVPTRTPEPTPIPPQVPGWDNLPLQVVCLEVEEIYPACPELSMNLAESISLRLMRSAGVRTGRPCDATLAVSVTGVSIKEKYTSGSQLYECFDGCEVNGKALLTAPGRTTLTATVSKRIEPPKKMPTCTEGPCLHNALGCLLGVNSPLNDLLASLWGVTVDDWNKWIFVRR